MKLFASDFDGTFFFMDRRPPVAPGTLRALREFREAGNLFGFCTGRPLEGLRISLDAAFHADFYITSSGACVLDGEEQVLFSRGMDRRAAQEILLWAKRLPEGPLFCSAQAQGRYYLFQETPGFPACPVVSSVEEIPEAEVHSLNLQAHSPEDAARLSAQLQERFGQAASPFQNVRYIDIVARGCSKGRGLEVLRGRFPDAVVFGIGDSVNDLPLLRAADFSYTFPYAPEEVRRGADKVVQDIEEALRDCMGRNETLCD